MRPDICEETEQAMSEEDNWLVERIKELQQENAELKARDRLHTAMFADADTCLKLKQQVLQYSRERADANRAELEAKQRVWVLEQENAQLRRVRDAAECLLDENEGFSLFNSPDTGEYELSVLADDLLKKLRDALQGKDGE